MDLGEQAPRLDEIGVEFDGPQDLDPCLLAVVLEQQRAREQEVRLCPVRAAIQRTAQRRDCVVCLALRKVELGAHEMRLGHVGRSGQDRVDDRAALGELLLRTRANAHVDQQLGLAQSRRGVLGRDFDRLFRRFEGTRQIAVAAAVRRQDQERLRIVRLGAGGLLDHGVGLGLVAARVIEARQCVDEIEIVGTRRDAVLQRLLGLVVVFAREVVAGDALVDVAPVLVGRDFERLQIGGLGVGVAFAIEREETGVEQLVRGTRIGLDQLEIERLGGGAIALADVVARERADQLRLLGLEFERLLVVGLGFVGALQSFERGPVQHVAFPALRVGGDHGFAFAERLIEFFLAAEQQELAECETRVEVGPVEAHGLLQLPIRLLRLLVGHVRLGQPVVGHRIIGRQLQRVLVFDHRFRRLLVLHVGVAAAHVLGELRLLVLTAGEGEGNAERQRGAEARKGADRRTASDPGVQSPGIHGVLAARVGMTGARVVIRWAARLQARRGRRTLRRASGSGATTDA